MTGWTWQNFPHPDAAFDFADERLRDAWPQLHAGDHEAFPDQSTIAEALAAEARLGEHLLGTDAAAISQNLQNAWRAYHRGDFREAWNLGTQTGPLGASVAIAAAGVHARFLIGDEKQRIACYETLVQRASDAIDLLPLNPNSHFRYAWSLGLLSREVSMMQVLTEGLGSKLRAALEAALELDADHAEAHTALGLYHAQVIEKIGAPLAKLTWRVDPEAVEAHLRTATRLTPHAPGAWIGLALGLSLLDARTHADECAQAFRVAAAMRPLDAQQELEIAYAQSCAQKSPDG
ncbi:MAG: hypothetical protein C4338_01505 [Rhodanobacteraceae bacterium]